MNMEPTTSQPDREAATSPRRALIGAFRTPWSGASTRRKELATVSWRRAIAAAAAAVFCLVALVVVLRSDGLPAVDAASSRATRWFVHESTGRVVLADGYGGRALASLQVGSSGDRLFIAEGTNRAFVLNEDTAEVRAVDTAELRLGPPVGVSALAGNGAVAGVSPAGLVVVDPAAGSATLLPTSGDPVAFSVSADPSFDVLVGPDGAIWSLDDGQLVRTTSAGSTRSGAGSVQPVASLVGNRPLVLDRDGRRARLGDGSWQSLPTEVDPSEIVVQVAGPPNDCGWIGGDDELWCVSDHGIDEQVTIDGLSIDGADRLAIAGSAAALVRRGPTEIVQFDWRSRTVIDTQPASISGDAALEITATVDLIWIDDTAGNFVWSVHPWGMESIAKNDDGTLLLGESGEIIDEGDANRAGVEGVDDRVVAEPEEREPDDNGIDDPPVAVDDLVTARGGAPVHVAVTANDYDPDGEAIAVVDVGNSAYGSVQIGTATTVVYNPEPGQVGMDRFEYTITDGDGSEATAEVIIDILSPDAANLPPVGTPDEVDTGPGVDVVVDVLLNDVDPERDALRIGSYSPPTQPVGVGTVVETLGSSDLPALEFRPAHGFEGTAIFSYRPVDALGALGAEVEVRVEVARVGDDNRPPVAGPDAVRLRRNTPTTLPVLVNDIDRDGDPLAITLVEPLPNGLDVDVQGDDLIITARPGSGSLIPFEYEIDDGRGHTARGSVLVAVIGDDEPNRPPVVSADTGTAVVGTSIILDVLTNDTDPDNDPLVVVDVTQPDDDRGNVVGLGREGVEFTWSSLDADEEQTSVRFTYTVSDGNGHEVVGEVSVVVLPEPLPEPPFARDDSTVTFVDTPVIIDVLRNDGDPSGERPALVGTPGCPAGGEAIVTGEEQVQYTPPRGQTGAFRCSYEVGNSQGLRDRASIVISVREPELTNQPPIAVLDARTVPLRATVEIVLTDNDSDPDGDDALLRVVSSTAPHLGSAERSGNTITFTAGVESGATNIRYEIVDEDGAVAVGNAQVRILEVANQAPRAIDVVRDVFAPATPLVFTVGFLATDPDGDSARLTISGANEFTTAGGVAHDEDRITISPPPGFIGVIEVDYTVTDEAGLRDTGRVTVNVREPENRPPVAVDDSDSVVNGGSVSVRVLLNDSDPDGNALTASIVSGPDPSLGSAAVNGDGSISFKAVPGASGVATIGYQASDGELSDAATLRVTVLACAESVPVTRDVFLATGYMQAIDVPLASYVTNGTVTDSSGPPGYTAGVYTPPAGENGNVTINYTAANGCGGTRSGTVTIDVNQQPIAQPQVISMSKNDTRELLAANLAGDDETLTISGSVGAPGWVTATSGSLLIDPPSATPGTTFSWTTTVTDPGGLRADVPITVTITNQAPIAVNDAVDASTGSGTFAIVANDTDPDDANATLKIQTIPGTVTMENGTSASITISADARQIIISAAGAQGVGSVQYTLVDPSGATAKAVVTVTGPPIVTTTTTLPSTTPPTTPPPTTPPPTTPPTSGPPTTGSPSTLPPTTPATTRPPLTLPPTTQPEG
jgi:hypothetical protein